MSTRTFIGKAVFGSTSEESLGTWCEALWGRTCFLQNRQNGILDFLSELHPELRTTIRSLIEIKSWINRHSKIPF